MALSQSDKDKISRYKIDIEKAKYERIKIKEDKKDKIAYYKKLIKGASSSSSKSSYKQQLERTKHEFDRRVETIKDKIEGYKESIARIKH